MLFKIAFKNIKKSFKDYFIYFLTLCIAVACFYMFNSLDSQAAVMRMNQSTLQVMELLMKVMSVVSVIVAVVLGFLIVHANRFLISRRKKEFAIYLTLGMGKGSVSAILLWETVFIGIISLAAGLGLGIFGSQLMSVFTANMFKADMSAFHFIFSKDAFIKSCIYYGIIYGAVLVFNTFMISGFKLITLLQAQSRSEKSPMRNNAVSVIVFAAAVFVLVSAYIRLAKGITYISTAREFVILIVLVIAATFFIFWSVSGFMINILTKNRRFWYKSTNMFVFRQLAGKVNTTVVSMTLICLMMFFAIVSLGGSFSMKNGLERQLEKNTPVDFNVRIYNQAEDETVMGLLKDAGFEVDNLKDTVEVNVYYFDNLKTSDFFGEKYESVKNAHKNVNFDVPEDIVKASEYNALAAVYGFEAVYPDENEYVCVADFDTMAQLRNSAMKEGTGLNIGGKTYLPKYSECIEGFVAMRGSNANGGIIVVPDSCDLSKALRAYTQLAGNFDTDSAEERSALEERLTGFDLWMDLSEKRESENKPDVRYFYETKEGIFASSLRLITIVSYVAIYVGITFLMASAALLSLNQLTDSEDSIYRYEILRKTGCDGRMIEGALFKQTGLFFLMPLVMALIHCVVGFRFFDSMLVVGPAISGTGVSILITTLVIGGIYGAYFLATYAGSRRIVGGGSSR